MAIPVDIRRNHEALGSNHCSSYTDQYGKYINGFTCPKSDKETLFCCGTSNYKYCCTKKDEIKKPLSDITIFFGALLGIFLVVSLLTTVSCLYCQCCILYKRRMSRVHGGPHYRLHCSNSGMSASASGGVANMYSYSTQNSAATTPLETVVPAMLSRDASQEMSSCDHILVDVECEIVPPPHSFRQLTPTPQLPDVTQETTEPYDKAHYFSDAADVSCTSTVTSPSMIVSDIPSQTSSQTVTHNRNLSTSTTGAAQTTSGSSETNSGMSTSFRSSCQSHDSGYSVTSDAVNSPMIVTNVQSPSQATPDENLYRSTKF